jgi:hypothetical protein
MAKVRPSDWKRRGKAPAAGRDVWRMPCSSRVQKVGRRAPNLGRRAIAKRANCY